MLEWYHDDVTVYRWVGLQKKIQNIVARPETFSKGQNDHETKKSMAHYVIKKVKSSNGKEYKCGHMGAEINQKQK